MQKKTNPHANQYQGQVSACNEGKQEISRPSTPTDGFVNEANRCLCAGALSVLELDRRPSQKRESLLKEDAGDGRYRGFRGSLKV